MGRIVLLVAIVMAASAPSEASAGSLGLTVEGLGGASITTNPTGSFGGCTPLRCYRQFSPGTRVTVTAVAGPGSRFATWSGACAGQTAVCVVVVGQGLVAATATFSPLPVWTFTSPGGIAGAVSPGIACGTGCRAYRYGSLVTVRAHPASGWQWARWVTPCAPLVAAECTFNITRGVDAKAEFRCVGDCSEPDDDCDDNVCTTDEPVTRAVTPVIRVAGRGSVLVNRLGCPGNGCRPRVLRNARVTVSVRSGSLRAWSGACRGRAVPCVFTATRDAFGRPPSVTASFEG
jgi:hypothetical protein